MGETGSQGVFLKVLTMHYYYYNWFCFTIELSSGEVGRGITYECRTFSLLVGASTTQENHLKFLFERNEDFCVIPSFAVTPPFGVMERMATIPGLTIDPTQVCIVQCVVVCYFFKIAEFLALVKG